MWLIRVREGLCKIVTLPITAAEFAQFEGFFFVSTPSAMTSTLRALASEIILLTNISALTDRRSLVKSNGRFYSADGKIIHVFEKHPDRLGHNHRLRFLGRFYGKDQGWFWRFLSGLLAVLR